MAYPTPQPSAYVKCKISKPTTVSVPTWFITEYMPKALSGYTKVYLYLLALSSQPEPETSLSLEEIALKLQMLYSEVIQALQYWNTEKVIEFKELSIDTFDIDFYMDKPLPPTEEIKSSTSKPLIRQTRPEYRTEEINLYLKDSEAVTHLFKVAEEYLGRLLTITDQKILYSLYDWLHMSFELIEYLIEHCASIDRKAIHYIEKVAISWVEDGITTVAAAKEKVAQNKRYYKILGVLGSSKNNITSAERKCIDKWFITYNFSMEVILEACKKTVMQTSRPSLNYVDSILASWYQSKVKTLQDITQLDKAHESKKALQLPAVDTAKAVSNKVSKFNQMYSHDWDFDEIEQLEQEYIDRKLNGGT